VRGGGEEQKMTTRITGKITEQLVALMLAGAIAGW
jgi:hypothetical protein